MNTSPHKLEENEQLVAEKIVELHYQGIADISVKQLEKHFENTAFICVEAECYKLKNRGFLASDDLMKIRASKDLLSFMKKPGRLERIKDWWNNSWLNFIVTVLVGILALFFLLKKLWDVCF